MRQFTATAYIIQEGRVLLLLHPKFSRWLPPGGHLEENETPVEAMHREVMEETGLEVEIIEQENIKVDFWNAKSILRPYLCLLEEFPAYKDKPAHQHIDFIYLTKPKTENPLPNDVKWFTLEEVESLSFEEIFEETKQTIRHLLCTVKDSSLPQQAST